MHIASLQISPDMVLILAFNVASACLSTFVTVHILLHKTDPKASLLWIALGWFAPIFGAVFYAMFGVNRLSRRANKLMKSDKPISQYDDAPFIDVRDDEPWAEVHTLSGKITEAPRLDGNSIEIIEGVEIIHQDMILAIDRAERTIILATYIFRKDALGQDIARALVRADQRGVDVKVLLDGVGNGLWRSETYKQLKFGGVDVHRFIHSLLPWRMPFLNLRNHRKILVVDNCIGFTGSMNIGHVSNLETHFKISGPILSQLIRAFSNDWRLGGGLALPDKFYREPDTAKGNTKMRVIQSAPLYSRERLRWVLMAAMAKAQKNIRIVTPYFIPDHGLLSALIMASLRGVKVEVILPRHSNYPFADWAGRHQLEGLLQAGCYIYLRDDIFDHSKIVTIDGHWSLIGSSNWDARSLRLNFELDIACEGKTFTHALESLIDVRKSKSKAMIWDDYLARSTFIKLKDSAARLLLPYL